LKSGARDSFVHLIPGLLGIIFSTDNDKNNPVNSRITGLRYRMEGSRQKEEGYRRGEEDLRCVQESDGRAAHVPRDYVPALVRQSRKHHKTDRIAQGGQ